MKKIGFIDYYIDEWHANNYPTWIRDTKRDFDVTLAWEETSKEGLKPLAAWCDEQRVTAASSMAQVIEESDAIVVLAPSNPEVHESLADLALQSGKPLYIDKPFAPDRAAAERLFAKAEQYKTPMMSSSALRFCPDLQQALKGDYKDVNASFAAIKGGGSSFWEYSIHQVEMLVMLMGTGAKRVMQCGNDVADHMVVDYGDGRNACMTLNGGQGFCFSAFYQDKNPLIVNDAGDFWSVFINDLLDFFETGKPCVPKKQTLEIATLVEVGIKALESKNSWLEI